METKTVDPLAQNEQTGMSALQSQMDELDALLDRLLKLPLGSGNQPLPPPSAPLKVIANNDEILEPLNESLDDPILSFDLRGQAQNNETRRGNEMNGPSNGPSLQALNPSQFGSLPGAKEEATPLSASALEPLIPPEEIPWIDDEPSTRKKSAVLASHGSERFRKAPTGAQVEIVIGPTCTVVGPETLSPSDENASQVTPQPSKLRSFFWRWNLLFDATMGRLFPALLRSNIRYFLSFVGLGLLVGSLYLAWLTWLK